MCVGSVNTPRSRNKFICVLLQRGLVLLIVVELVNCIV